MKRYPSLRRTFPLGIVLLLLLCCGPLSAQVIDIATVSTDGIQGDGECWNPVIAATGRLVAFISQATTLAPGHPRSTDGYLRDRQKRETRLVAPWPTALAMSADGRFVAFTSWASDLVPGDTNNASDVFVYDRQTSAVTRVSVPDGGTGEAGGWSDLPAISASGRYVAFCSGAENLVAGDTNQAVDVFVHDRQTHNTVRVSVPDGGGQADGGSSYPAISGDGRFVAFVSAADNLVPGDTNLAEDVFVRDLQRPRHTELVSVTTAGDQPGWVYSPAISGDGRYVVFCSYNYYDASDPRYGAFVRDRQAHTTTLVGPGAGGGGWISYAPAAPISADGRFVAFVSWDNTLVPGDTNDTGDVFVHEAQTGTYARVSVSATGAEANGSSWEVAISPDGKYLALTSWASNLVPNDTNTWSDTFVALNPVLAQNPTLSWTGEPGYTDDGVSPNKGAPGAKFRFRVKLTDPNGNEPTFVRAVLYRDGTPWTTVTMTPESGSTATGRIYRTTRALPVGNYACRFVAADVDGPAMGPPTVLQVGPVMPSPPYLAWVGTSGYETDGVQPQAGNPHDTWFHFRTKYCAHDGDMPASVSLRLLRNGTTPIIWEFASPLSGTDPVTGLVYGVDTKLDVGSYTYWFFAADQHGEATGVAGVGCGNLTVGSGGWSLIAALVATGTRAGGAQVTFSLSRDSHITATVLNVAGRPVRRLATDQAASAGLNTLVWDGLSDTGLRAPPGMYLVSLSSKAPSGAVSRAVTSLPTGR